MGNGGTYDTNWEFGVSGLDKIVRLNNYFKLIEEEYYIYFFKYNDSIKSTYAWCNRGVWGSY